MNLSLVGLGKTYKNFFSSKKTEAVRNVSFEIKGGEIFALLGPNGAGKSTVIKMIAGLIKPTTGKVLFDNSLHKNYKVLSAVLEGSRNVYWRLTPLENLYYFANLRGVRSNAVREKALLLLNELDIEAQKKNQSRHLSRGMLQKVAIAVALITNPEIVLLDEPTLGVDVASGRKIKEKIRKLAHEEGKVILLTTHQMELVDQLADRVGVIQDGELIKIATLEDFKRNSSEFVYHLGLKGLDLSGIMLDDICEIIRVNRNGDYVDMEINCRNENTVSKLLSRLATFNSHFVYLKKKSENLEDVFLQSLDKREGL